MTARRLARCALGIFWTLCIGGGIAGAQDGGRILVMPFENVRREARIFWITEAAAVLLTDDLGALGASPITRQERQQAFERLQVPPAATLTDASVIRIGQLVGADRVVMGSLQMDDDALVVRARSVTLDTGRVQADVTERGSLLDLYAIFGRVADRIAPSTGRRAERGEGQPPPIAAFESYIKGLLAETTDTAVGYLRAALKLQPSFDRARLGLWDAYTDAGDYEEAVAAVRSVGADSPYGRHARFLAGLSLIELKKYDEAFQSFKALADIQPAPPVLNNLGVIELRRGVVTQIDPPTHYFNQAAQADPDDPDYVFNLGYASWMDRDTQAAIYWLRETVRRSPADGEAHYVLGTALAASGNVAEAAREKELANRLSSTFAQWDKRPSAETVPKGLERIKSDVELPHARRIDTRLTSSEQREQADLARFYLDRARRQYVAENDRQAAAELNRALYLSPYLSEAHLLLGRIHLRSGRVHDAIDALKISLWSAETPEAHAVLGEAYRQAKDVGAARAEAERALALDPMSAEAKRLIDLLNSR
ncbi:MAG TPA: tetratricopeptide repeat protein [Vicinamibacterales bacterium]|nr:tetratricopeptide repeat protein [Vicinamibacterales bacterium]